MKTTGPTKGGRGKEIKDLQDRKAGLESTVAAQRESEVVSIKVRSFLADFSEMEVRQAKAVLQGIIKTARVYKDGRIELEFR